MMKRTNSNQDENILPTGLMVSITHDKYHSMPLSTMQIGHNKRSSLPQDSRQACWTYAKLLAVKGEAHSPVVVGQLLTRLDVSAGKEHQAALSFCLHHLSVHAWRAAVILHRTLLIKLNNSVYNHTAILPTIPHYMLKERNI